MSAEIRVEKKRPLRRLVELGTVAVVVLALSACESEAEAEKLSVRDREKLTELANDHAMTALEEAQEFGEPTTAVVSYQTGATLLEYEWNTPDPDGSSWHSKWYSVVVGPSVESSPSHYDTKIFSRFQDTTCHPVDGKDLELDEMTPENCMIGGISGTTIQFDYHGTGHIQDDDELNSSEIGQYLNNKTSTVEVVTTFDAPDRTAYYVTADGVQKKYSSTDSIYDDNPTNYRELKKLLKSKD